MTASPDPALAPYLRRFAALRTDRTGPWMAATRGQAPHKPLLLLAVLDLFAQGCLYANLVEITPELGNLFAIYWSKALPESHTGNLFLPFYHLRSSGFWHLVLRLGKEAALAALRQIGSLRQLRDLVLGARLDETLYGLLCMESARAALRFVLIETYFAPELGSALLAQSTTNAMAYEYSECLIESARKKVREVLPDEEAYQPAARDQGFRRAITKIYDHRCAFCGVRMLTPDGHSAVEAAHIVPWSMSHNDDPHNGLALCRLYHWTFDEGLIAVSYRYTMALSPEIRGRPTCPGAC